MDQFAWAKSNNTKCNHRTENYVHQNRLWNKDCHCIKQLKTYLIKCVGIISSV